jgi:hypothetical protein
VARESGSMSSTASTVAMTYRSWKGALPFNVAFPESFQCRFANVKARHCRWERDS